tara:strand:+ start:650 stop:886 length:237 start_codon:yes stop_codon:yes gene_type:complete
MKSNFNVDEILKSIDDIVDNNKYKNPDKIIDISVNPITEKIIIDAEESLSSSSNLNLLKPLILKEELSEPLILKKEYS